MSLRITLIFLMLAALARAQTLDVVSAASLVRGGALAPDMIATAFSTAIASSATPPEGSPLPFTLAGYSIKVGETPAPLFSASVGQIRFLVPEGVALGDTTVTLHGQDGVLASAGIHVALVAPGVFSAGLLVTVGSDGARATADLFQIVDGGVALPRPFLLNAGQLYLQLLGTGIRGGRSAVTAAIGGKPVPVVSAGPHATLPGIDQVELGPLPSDLSDRRGELDVVVTAGGIAANRVTVAPNMPALADWGPRAQLIEANSEMAVGEVGGKIFVLGGYPSSRQTRTTVQVYDPVEDRWALTTPMPIALNHNMSVSVNGKLYMIGGQTTDAGAGNFSDRVFEYDPDTTQWRERSRMPTARGAGVAVVADSKIYVAGGRPPRGADFAVYDPQADSWRSLPDLPTPRNHLAGAALGGKVYIVGGRFEAGFQSPQSDVVEVYDPSANSWSSRAPLPKPRGGINGIEANGCLHIFGGEGATGAPNGLHPDHDVYNPINDAWTRLDPMPLPIHGVTGAAFVNGLIYLPGGGVSQGGNSGTLRHQVYRPGVVCR